uniref:Uncharacterized protein n=1 Tax=Kalanchoe fedtschenkoi TaxID=63787 RepID=A0A7N0TQ38_KALFE
MKTYFDAENLPLEFGGQATLSYDYEEFSRMMAHDDLKREAYWGLKTDTANERIQAGAALEPVIP